MIRCQAWQRNYLCTWQLQTPSTVHTWRGCNQTGPIVSRCLHSLSTWRDEHLAWSCLTSFLSALLCHLRSWSTQQELLFSFFALQLPNIIKQAGAYHICHDKGWWFDLQWQLTNYFQQLSLHVTFSVCNFAKCACLSLQSAEHDTFQDTTCFLKAAVTFMLSNKVN